MAASPDLFARGLEAAHLLRLGPASHVRLEALRRGLEDRVKSDDPRIPLWLAAGLCRSSAERESFLKFFRTEPEVLFKPVERPTEVREEAGPSVPVSKKPPPTAWWRNRHHPALLVFVLTAALIALAVWGGWVPGPSRNVSDHSSVAGNTTPSEASSSKLDGSRERPSQTSNRDGKILAAFALSLPILVAAIYAHFELMRRRQLRRDHAPQPQRRVALIFAESDQGMMTGVSWRLALQRLRKHRRVPGTRLDIPASIRATVAIGGMTQLRLLTRPQSPEYLLLSERRSRRDHLAWYAGLLARRMREEQLTLDHFEFVGDPRRLRAVGARQPQPLASVLALHARAHPMLLAECYDTLSTDVAARWVEMLRAAPTPAFLDPRAQPSWNFAEQQARQAGIEPFSADASGLAAYAAFLESPGDAARASLLGDAFDLPEGLARWRAVLVSNAAPVQPLVSGLMDDLEAWLGKAGLDWLRALALFPYFECELTAHMGLALGGRFGTPMMDEALWLRLARLPWMRSGTMPDWLRKTLVRGLAPDRLYESTVAIQAFLLPQEEGAVCIDMAAGSDMPRRNRLLEWLRLNPQSVFADRILIDALAGRTPEELGIEVSPALRDRLSYLWRGRIVRAVTLALLATAIIAGLLPFAPLDLPSDLKTLPQSETSTTPVVEQPQPVDVTAPTAPSGSDGSSGGNTVLQVPAAKPPATPEVRKRPNKTAALGRGKAPNIRPQPVERSPFPPAIESSINPVQQSRPAEDAEARSAYAEMEINDLKPEFRTVLDGVIKRILLNQFDIDKNGLIDVKESQLISCGVLRSIDSQANKAGAASFLDTLFFSDDAVGDIGFDREGKNAMQKKLKDCSIDQATAR